MAFFNISPRYEKENATYYLFQNDPVFETNPRDAYCLGSGEEVLQRLCMTDAKSVGSTLPANYKLPGKQSPKTKVEKTEMMKVPSASAIRSLMYAMVCTRPDIGYAVRVVSRFMSNLRRKHRMSR